MEIQHSATYNVLHNVVEEFEEKERKDDQVNEQHPIVADDAIYEDDDYESVDLHHHSHHHEVKQTLESFDFNDVESIMWRKVSV